MELLNIGLLTEKTLNNCRCIVINGLWYVFEVEWEKLSMLILQNALLA